MIMWKLEQQHVVDKKKDTHDKIIATQIYNEIVMENIKKIFLKINNLIRIKNS